MTPARKDMISRTRGCDRSAESVNFGREAAFVEGRSCVDCIVVGSRAWDSVSASW